MKTLLLVLILFLFQIDNVRFRELTHEQVFGSMHEQFMRL